MEPIVVTDDDISAFKANALAYITHNSPVVGLKFLIEISSPIPQFDRWRYMDEVVKAGDVLEIQLSGHPMRSSIYIRKNTRLEIYAKHSSCQIDSLGYHRIGHGTEK